ncbi:MAG: hypothetical protein WBM00_02830 [Solirubrobacterales bacterium]
MKATARATVAAMSFGASGRRADGAGDEDGGDESGRDDGDAFSRSGVEGVSAGAGAGAGEDGGRSTSALIARSRGMTGTLHTRS